MKQMPVKDKWTAMLMSLVVPGAGQLYAGSWSCLVWFVSAGSLIALFSTMSTEQASVIIIFVRVPVFGLFSLICAEHAKRCLEPESNYQKSVATQTQISCQVDRSSKVQLNIKLAIHRPCAEVWNDISNLEQFIKVDPFHISIDLNESQIQQGTLFQLIHQAFGMRFHRVGRILKWQEGYGYAFSDLSPASPHGLFPHVFFVSVTPVAENVTCLKVQVRGKWMRKYAPRILIQLWLKYVCQEHARLLAKVY